MCSFGYDVAYLIAGHDLRHTGNTYYLDTRNWCVLGFGDFSVHDAGFIAQAQWGVNAGAILTLPRDILFNEFRPSMPQTYQACCVQEAPMTVLRSPLFVPGNQPNMLEKALGANP